MKLMFISDIHGSLPATERVLELFVQGSARWLVILDGVLSHGPRNALPEGYAPTKVVERLNEVAHKVIAVRGNYGNGVDQMLLHFPITTPWQQVLPKKQRLFLTHGHLFSSENLPALDRNDVLAYGHTHLPVAGQRGEIFHFNPGSVSISRSGNLASYSILDDDILSVIALSSQNTIAQVVISL